MNLDDFELAMKESEKDFVKVKEFLEENPTATAYDIGDAVGISHRQIMKWIDEGRLEMKSNSGLGSRKSDSTIIGELNSLKKENDISKNESSEPKRRTGMYVSSKK